MSSIGLLTAGVAHEINNPLEGIGNYVSLLERPDLTAEERRRYLELVRHGFQRIGDIVRDLLRFARPRPGEGTAELGVVVESALKLARYSDRTRGVVVEREGFERPLHVVGDPGRLEQLVFNLLLNAGQVLDGAGRVWIRARTAHDGAGLRQLELAVEDTGPGIAPEHIDKLFDPFFTTSGGTGLGLPVSYGIARAHGGTLSAENRAEGGARFVLRLPWPEDVRTTP
jgi:two-component system, NtrC family, sensor kinase